MSYSKNPNKDISSLLPLKANTSLKPKIRTKAKVNAILHLENKKSIMILKAGFHQEQNKCVLLSIVQNQLTTNRNEPHFEHSTIKNQSRNLHRHTKRKRKRKPLILIEMKGKKITKMNIKIGKQKQNLIILSR